MRIRLTLAVLFLHSIVFSQTLTLNQGFGNAGIAATNLSNNAPHFTFATGRQGDGKMILGGSSLLRVFTNGNVDSSFGVNGMAVKADFPYINTLAIQTDDKIVCAQFDYSQVFIKRFSAAGETDSSFNNAGIAILSEPGKTIYISKIRLQADGKILLVGNSLAAEKTRFFVARYSSDGSPDLSFNGTGRVTLDVSPWDNAALDIAQQSNGQLVLAGSAKSSILAEPHLYILRLNSDGAVDSSFNGTGSFQYSNTSEIANLLHVYPDDKILIAGTSAQQLLLMRLQANGIADSSYGINGLVMEAGLGVTSPKELHLLNDSNLIVTGQSSAAGVTDWEYAAFKFTYDGSLNDNFNDNGKTFLASTGNDYVAGSILLNDESVLLGGYSDSAAFASTTLVSNTGQFDIGHGAAGIKSLEINGSDEVVNTLLKQADGKLIAIGNKTNALATFLNAVVVRYNADGGIDSSFRTNGVVDIAEEKFVFHSGVLQPDGKILLVGDQTGEAPDFIPNISVLRLNNNGSIDNSFGNNGKVIFASANTSGYGKGLALLTDNRIIIAGKDAENSKTIVAFMLNSNGSLDNGFGVDGKRSFDPGFAENGLGSITVQSDNRILLAGYLVENNSQSGFFCMRLQINGSTDNSFGNNGIYRTSTSSASFLELNSMMVTADDKILLAGHVSNPSGRSSSVRVIRLLANGIPDNTFNGNGNGSYYKNLSQDSTFLIPNAIAIHPDNSVYIVGASVNNSGKNSQFIIRIRQSGSLDSTISTEGSGWYYSNQGGLNAVLNDIVISADSSIYVGGSQDLIGTNIDMIIAAYKRLPDTLGITYIFNGNGLWTDANNWLNEQVPPLDLPNGASIIVAPITNGSAILNVPQNILPGAKIIVGNNARMEIQSNLNVGN